MTFHFKLQNIKSEINTIQNMRQKKPYLYEYIVRQSILNLLGTISSEDQYNYCAQQQIAAQTPNTKIKKMTS